MKAADPLPSFGSRLVPSVALAILLVAGVQAATQYVPSTWIQRDGRFYVNVNTTLVEEASFVQEEFAASWYEDDLGWNHDLDASWSNLARGADGRRMPKHTIALPILSTPLFWAFGLLGTLLFNVLFFGLAGGALFAFCQRWASSPAAAAAVFGATLATSLREYVYDYHVDVLILGLFALALTALSWRRGAWAGFLAGLAVMCRPTVLLWVPALAILAMLRGDRATLGRALLAGTGMIAVIAAANWMLYGAPWWSGYNRVLVRVDGTLSLADVGGAFDVPLSQGLGALWGGPYGVSHRSTFLALAGPGLAWALWRRRGLGVAILYAVVASVAVFAKYTWYGDRFLWPTLALLTPAIAMTLDGVSTVLRRRPGLRAPGVAAFAIAAMVVASRGSALSTLEGEAAASLAGGALFSGALAFAAALVARRARGTRLTVLAPLVLGTLPGVLDRLATPSIDLGFALLVMLSLSVKRTAVALGLACGAAGVAVLASDSPGDTWWQAPTPIALGALALIGVPLLRRRAWLLAPLVLLAVPRLASLGSGSTPLFALACGCVALPATLEHAGSALTLAWRRLDRPRAMILLVGVASALVAIGAARRGDTSFRIASPGGVRHAEVYSGTTPCDFLAWEHLNWECATLDRGVHGETGLATSAPLHVGGRESEMFLLTASPSRPRTVRWPTVAEGETLELRVALADELPSAGTLEIAFDDQMTERIDLADLAGGRVHVHRLPVPRAGADLALTLHGRAVLVDGRFTAR